MGSSLLLTHVFLDRENRVLRMDNERIAGPQMDTKGVVMPRIARLVGREYGQWNGARRPL